MSSLSFLLFPILMCLCFGIVIAVVGGGIFFYVRRSTDALNRTWGDLGVRNGLTLKPGGVFSYPELNGNFRQRPLRLYIYSTGGQRNRTTYTAVAVTVNNPANSRLEITPSGTVVNFFGKLLNAQDVAIGNPAFDARFVIKSNPPEFAMKFLGDARVQMEIMEIPGVFWIELEGLSLRYTKHGLEENSDFLTKMFNIMSDMADRLERN